MLTVQEIVISYQRRVLSENMATNLLDAHEIRGSFRDDGSYIGYDYKNQKWVEVDADPKVLSTARAKRAIRLEFAPEDPYDEDEGESETATARNELVNYVHLSQFSDEDAGESVEILPGLTVTEV